MSPYVIVSIAFIWIFVILGITCFFCKKRIEQQLKKEKEKIEKKS